MTEFEQYFTAIYDGKLVACKAKISKDFIDCKISQEEAENQYVNVLQECSNKQIDIAQYSQEKITEAAQKASENRVANLQNELKTQISDYEKQIEDINKKIDSFTDKLTKSYGDMYSFEKNKDGKIVSARFNDSIGGDIKQLEEYYNVIEKLKSRGVSDSMLGQLANVSQEEGLAMANYWDKSSDKELKMLNDKWDKYNNMASKVSNSLYENQMNDTVTDMTNTLKKTVESSDEYSKIGTTILDEILKGMVDDGKMSATCALITESIKKNFGLQGFDEINNTSKEMTDAVPTGVDGGKNVNANGKSFSSADKQATSGTNITINQNNYSPKALDAYEVHKATQNAAAQVAISGR